MRVAQVVAEGMLQVRMRSRLQFTVEQQMPIESTRESTPLVRLDTPAAAPAVAPVMVIPVAETVAPASEPVMAATETVVPVAPQKGLVIEWPSRLSATLRRMKSALASGSNSVALRAFEAPHRY